MVFRPAFPRFFRSLSLILAVGYLLAPQRVQAQAGAPDPTFLEHPTAVSRMILLADGKLLVTGTNLGTAPIQRLLADGTVDATFTMKEEETGHTFDGLSLVGNRLLVLRDGVLSRYLLNGRADPRFTVDSTRTFNSYLPLKSGQIVTAKFDVLSRFNQDGTADTAFHSPTINGGSTSLPFGFGGALAGYLPGPDGTLYIWGTFTAVDGLPRHSVARLNRDGTVDPTFIPALSEYFWISRLIVDDSGALLVCGQPVLSSGIVLSPGKVLRLRSDGSPDNTFRADTLSTFSSASLNGMLKLSSGKIFLWGRFSSNGGTTTENFAQLNADGTLDTSFVPSVRGSIRGVMPLPDGKILVAGLVAGTPFDNYMPLVRLKADGTLDMAFDLFPENQINSIGGFYADQVLLQPDGRIIAALRYYYLNSGSTGASTGAVDGAVLHTGTTTGVTNISLSSGGTLSTGGVKVQGGNLTNIATTVNGVIVNGAGTISVAGAGIPVVTNSISAAGTTITGGTLALNTATTVNAGTASNLVLGAGTATLSTNLLTTAAAAARTTTTHALTHTTHADSAFSAFHLIRYLGDGETIPHRPIKVKADSLRPHLARVTWNAVANVTGYRVERQVPNGEWTFLGTTRANQTYYNDVKTAADADINYLYRISAENVVGQTLPSPVAQAVRPGYFQVISQPAVSVGKVDLSWTASSGHWYYEIYRYENDSTRKRVGRVSAETTTFSDTTVLPLTGYHYEVCAHNVAGDSFAESYGITTLYDKPATTPEIFVAGATTGAIRLLWTASPHATGYRVERNSGNGWTLLTTLEADASFYEDTSTTPGEHYQYRVTSLGDIGNSAPTTAYRVRAPSANAKLPGRLDTRFEPVPALQEVSHVQLNKDTLYYVQGSAGYLGLPAVGKLNLRGKRLAYNPPLYTNNTSSIVFYAFEDGSLLSTLGLNDPTLIRITPQQNQDDNFNAYVNGYYLNQILPLRNGETLLVGAIESIGYYWNGSSVNSYGIARLRPDGHRASGFSMAPALGNDEAISAVELSDGKILVAKANAVWRLLPNGYPDRSFGHLGRVTFSGENLWNGDAPVACLTLQPDGKILVGGLFSQLNDGEGQVSSQGLVRLTAEGKIDPTLDIGSGFNPVADEDGNINLSYVQKIVVDAKGRIVIQGYLMQYQGLACSGGLIRLLPDGTLDPTFLLPGNFDGANFTLSPDNETFYAGTYLHRYFYGQ